MKASFALRRLVAATLTAALALSSPSRLMAEDIDIFTAAPPDGAKPNILVVIDNSANWSSTLSTNACASTPGGNMNENTMFAAEMCALYKVVGGLNDKVRVGLMMFTEGGDNGAYVRFAIRDMNDTNKKALQDILTKMDRSTGTGDGTGANQPYARTMFEAFKYFGGHTDPANATKANPNGQTPVSNIAFGPTAFTGGFSNSTGTKKRDYKNNSTVGSAAKAGADVNVALGGINENDYISPITETNICAKNFIVFISNGNPGTGADDSTNPAKMTPTGGVMDTIKVSRKAIPTAATEIHAQKFDEMAEFLRQTDVSPLTGQQRVNTYTVAVYKPSKITFDVKGNITSETIATQDQSMIKLMKSAADVGGGKYFAGRDADAVAQALFDIMNEVQAVNSVFVSASLPVSVNNQGTFLNQVYMGMFRPDGSGNPRWLGNLKEYKFKLDSLSGAISLTDSGGTIDAVNPATGFISPKSISYWTRGGNDPSKTGWPNKDFWINNQSGTPASPSDSPDGEVVEKGGASNMLRLDFATSQDKRVVYTCLQGGACKTFSDPGVTPDTFDTNTIKGTAYETAFGSTTAELPLLVNWIRGQDNKTCDPSDTTNCGASTWSSPEAGPGLPATVRPSIHGDVLHSRPVVINYPGKSCYTCGPWVFYGANDGMLRAVKGGQDNDPILSKDGHEAWSFIPPEFYAKYRRLRETKPELRTATNLPGTSPKDYFFDGPIGVWEEFQDPVTKLPATPQKWIFVTARRGGRVIYAFDVSAPDAPKFMWKKTQVELPNLGQTWSTPWAFKLAGVDDPFLMFGAGYDVGEDLVPAVANGDVGRGIYVLNARTGEVIKGGIVVDGFIQADSKTSAAIKDSVPSDMSLLVGTNANGDSQVYRGYVGDTNGNVWRLDIPDKDLTTWRLSAFAALGSGKKFFFAPDVVHAGGWDVVLAGTGDREKPLVKDSLDSFYAMNDVNAAVGAAATYPAALVVSDLTKLSGTGGVTTAGGATCTGGVCVCDPTGGCKGWYRELAAGEKVVNSPLTVAGTTYFSTNKPKPATAGTCDVNLGEARAYGLSFFGGTPTKVQPDGTIGTPLTGGGLPPSPVGGVVEFEPGKQVAFIIGAGDKGSPVEGSRVTISVSSTRRKVYWNAATDK
ncbi:MAG: hypothetical protein H7Y14_11470 [Burkholderiales bacterium]|nr:hypothetical protein [Burkholderiales bacterium]